MASPSSLPYPFRCPRVSGPIVVGRALCLHTQGQTQPNAHPFVLLRGTVTRKEEKGYDSSAPWAVQIINPSCQSHTVAQFCPDLIHLCRVPRETRRRLSTSSLELWAADGTNELDDWGIGKKFERNNPKGNDLLDQEKKSKDIR